MLKYIVSRAKKVYKVVEGILTSTSPSNIILVALINSNVNAKGYKDREKALKANSKVLKERIVEPKGLLFAFKRIY